MSKKIKLLFLSLLVLGACLGSLKLSAEPDFDRGIYLTYNTVAFLPKKLEALIALSEKNNINTFVIDYTRDTNAFETNIQKVNSSKVRWIARIVIFQDGATWDWVNKGDYRDRVALMKKAVALGAKGIQLDYIRFQDAGGPSTKKSQKIYEIVKYYREETAKLGVSLQMDVFGATAYNKVHNIIGQDLGLLQSELDTVCPMLYPSHFYKEPNRMSNPYETYKEGIIRMKSYLDGRVRIVPYIQGFDMKLAISGKNLKEYMRDQMKACHENGAHGWYVWNANNDYRDLFELLESDRDL
jgi:hypothetical protein